MAVNSPFLRLLPEIHLQIALYLTDVDSTLLSLACKHLYHLYTTYRLPAIPLEVLDEGREHLALEWLQRIRLLRSLRSWNLNIDQKLSHSDSELARTLAICVVCAKFKPRQDGWIKGWRYGDWSYKEGEIWQRVRAHVMFGELCDECCDRWEGFAQLLHMRLRTFDEYRVYSEESPLEPGENEGKWIERIPSPPTPPEMPHLLKFRLLSREALQQCLSDPSLDERFGAMHEIRRRSRENADSG